MPAGGLTGRQVQFCSRAGHLAFCSALLVAAEPTAQHVRLDRPPPPAASGEQQAVDRRPSPASCRRWRGHEQAFRDAIVRRR